MVLVNIKKIKFYSSRERKEENDYRVVTQLRITLSKLKRTHLSDQIKICAFLNVKISIQNSFLFFNMILELMIYSISETIVFHE